MTKHMWTLFQHSRQIIISSISSNNNLPVINYVEKIGKENQLYWWNALVFSISTQRQVATCGACAMTYPSLEQPALISSLPIWRVLNKLRCERLPNNEALQWAVLLTQSLLRAVFCNSAVSVNFKHDIMGSKFTLIIETLKPVQSWLC